MNENFYEILREIDEIYEHNYMEKMVELIEEKQIPISSIKIKTTDAAGMTLPSGIHINSYFLGNVTFFKQQDSYFAMLFILFHEIAHYMRLQRNDKTIKGFNALDFETFFAHVNEEETIANRYAEIMFIKLVGRKCYEVSHMYSKIYHNEPVMRMMYESFFNEMKSLNLDYVGFMESNLMLE